MQKLRKAILPVAGLGTRFLLVTKAMLKELMPIIEKPLIQCAVEEAIVAIDSLIFVAGRNKSAIEDHFENNQELEMALRAKGKGDQAKMVKNILTRSVECIFVRQPEQLGLGHAVLCAERAVIGDPFAVLLANDFLTDYEPGMTADLVQAFAISSKSQLLVMEVDGPDISKYGVVVPNVSGACIVGLVEKPGASETPLNLASIGCYVLTPDIFDTLRGLNAGSVGEIQLADEINIHVEQGSVETVRPNGRRFDCGSVDGFMQASNHEYEKRLVI